MDGSSSKNNLITNFTDQPLSVRLNHRASSILISFATASTGTAPKLLPLKSGYIIAPENDV